MIKLFVLHAQWELGNDFGNYFIQFYVVLQCIVLQMLQNGQVDYKYVTETCRRWFLQADGWLWQR